VRGWVGLVLKVARLLDHNATGTTRHPNASKSMFRRDVFENDRGALRSSEAMTSFSHTIEIAGACFSVPSQCRFDIAFEFDRRKRPCDFLHANRPNPPLFQRRHDLL
jgi:hypothetical protein